MLAVVDSDGMTPSGASIDEIVREGAKRMLAAALEAEVNAYLAQLADQRDEQGRRLVVRNGHHAGGALTAFAKAYGTKFPKAVAKITGDEDVLLAFYDYPAEHWIHLRTNPIESTFSTVRLLTKVTKGAGSRAAGLAMTFKHIESAQSHWRAVSAPHLVALVRAGARFEHGVLAGRDERRAA